MYAEDLVLRVGVTGIDELIARVSDGIGDGGVALRRHYGEQRHVQRLRNVTGPRIVTDKQLAVGEQPHQLPYRAGLDLVKHTSLHLRGQQRFEASVVLFFSWSAIDQDLGVMLLDQPARHFGEAVDGPAFVMPQRVDPHGDQRPR
ncbi:hypothetical protein D3C80_1590080 [compost metagenome]